MTASPNRPHGAALAHTARGSLCLGSWAVRAAYTRCSLQPAPSMLLCLSDHSAAHTASRCCRLHRRDCSGTDRFSCSDSDDICRFRGHRRRGSLPRPPDAEASRGQGQARTVWRLPGSAASDRPDGAPPFCESRITPPSALQCRRPARKAPHYGRIWRGSSDWSDGCC